MSLFLSLDPGVTTGYCLGRMHENTRMDIAYNEAKLQPADLLLTLQDIEPGVIVYEDFKYRNRARDGLELFSVQLIGIVEAYATLATHGVQLKKQQPSEGKGYYKDSTLQRLNLYQQGLVHGRDAARHLLHYMTFGPGFQYWGKNDPTFKMVSYAAFGV